MANYTFSKEDMSLRIRVTEGEPFFQIADILNSVGMARTMIEPHFQRGATWANYTTLIGAIDAVERGGSGMGRKRVNPIYRRRIDKLRNWIEWEIIPQLSKMVVG